MLRVELATQLRRAHSVILFGVLVVLPILAAVTEARGRGHVATFSALNFAEGGLSFMDPVLFGLVAAVFGAFLGGSDRDWGTLRYLYVRPVSRRRLLTGKWWALVVCTVLSVAFFLVVALLAGFAAFGWHPFHRAGTGNLAAANAAWALAGAGGYLLACLLSIGAIALALGLLLPRSIEALALTIAFLLGSTLIDNLRPLHDLVVILPTHYWMRWTQLFHPGSGSSGLVVGLAVQAATIAVAATVAYTLLYQRDPAA